MCISVQYCKQWLPVYSWGARYELQVPPEVSTQEARQDQQQGLPRAGSGLPGGDRCRDGSEREKQSRVSVPLNRNKKQKFCAQGTLQMKGRWEFNIYVWFPIMYSQ